MRTDTLPDGGIKYRCECGQEIILYLDNNEKLERLVKCFDCQQPITKLFDLEEGEQGLQEGDDEITT